MKILYWLGLLSEPKKPVEHTHEFKAFLHGLTNEQLIIVVLYKMLQSSEYSDADIETELARRITKR